MGGRGGLGEWEVGGGGGGGGVEISEDIPSSSTLLH